MFHSLIHFSVIQIAHIKIKILKCFCSAADLPGRIVFPCVLLLQGGASAPALDPSHPNQAAAVCGSAVWSGADSDGYSLPVSCSPGGWILCVAVWVGGLWGVDFTRSITNKPIVI